MDGGTALTPDEVQGRNMWIVWTGGNDRFWDELTDLHLRRLRPAEDRCPRTPGCRYSRRHRAGTTSAWSTSPASSKATAPDPEALRAVARRAAVRLRAPIRSPERAKVSGCRDRRARQEHAGRLATTATPSGIVGLRLFPNPDFDEAAAQASGTPDQLLQRSRATTTSRDLVRPYRVGMSCGVLPRRTEPGQAAGRSREPEVGEPELERSARSTAGSDRIFSWTAETPTTLHVPAAPHRRARARSTPRWCRPTTSTTRAR